MAARRPILMVEQGGRGGVADYTGELVRALAARGERVELVTTADHRFELPADVRVHALTFYLRPTSAWRRAVRRAGLGPAANALLYLLAVRRMAGMARRCRLVHVQGGFPPLTLVLAAALWLVRLPLVHTPHNTFDRQEIVGRRGRLRAALFTAARRGLERLSARIVVHARADLPRLSAAGRARAVVIPHGEYGALARAGGAADREAARAWLGLPAEATVALLFGQLRPDKGVRDLLLAAREADGVHVVLAGEDLGALEESAGLLEDPGLAPRVVVRSGFQSLEDAARLFAAADAAVLPYRVASQSGVLLLAYGFATPVVVYPVGGLPEAVEDGETGWVCPRADPGALATVLREVAAAGAEERARRGAAGARLASTRFSWETIARRTEDEAYAPVAS